MEITEIVSYFLDLDKNILEVNFRTINDDDESVRIDNIDYNLVEEYGYELESETFDLFGFDDDEDNTKIDEIELDEESLISFLNEYYTVNPTILPKPEIL